MATTTDPLDLTRHYPKHAAKPSPRCPVPVHLGDLMGPEGNAFIILGRCRESFKLLGMLDDYSEFSTEAKSGNYDHLLDTVLAWCEDLDGSIEDYRDYKERKAQGLEDDWEDD